MNYRVFSCSLSIKYNKDNFKHQFLRRFLDQSQSNETARMHPQHPNLLCSQKDLFDSFPLEGAALIRGRRLLEGGAYFEIQILGAALIRGRHLIEGGEKCPRAKSANFYCSYLHFY